MLLLGLRLRRDYDHTMIFVRATDTQVDFLNMWLLNLNLVRYAAAVWLRYNFPYKE